MMPVLECSILRARPRRRVPRRDRRGLAALFSMSILVAAGVAFALLWQAGIAGERVRGHARHLAEAVAAEGYGLHHWLHGERTAVPPGVTAPAEGTARELTAAEDLRLAGHSATARWRRDRSDATRPVLPRGWGIVHLVGTAGGLPDGVLVLRPSNDVVAQPTWEAARQALDVTLGRGAGGAATLAASALADYDPARDRALLASRFARLDTDAVLRELHAGHPRLPVEAEQLLMGGNDLQGVAVLEGGEATFPEIDGDCRPPVPPPGTLSGTLCAESLGLQDTLAANAGTTLTAATSEDVTVRGDVTGIARIRTGDATVSGTVTTPAVTACADADADLCGGGDLDLEGGTGIPDWTEASVFADVVIRDGNRLTGVRLTIADTAIFGTLVGALTVSGCLRVVSPFIHGARC